MEANGGWRLEVAQGVMWRILAFANHWAINMSGGPVFCDARKNAVVVAAVAGSEPFSPGPPTSIQK